MLIGGPGNDRMKGYGGNDALDPGPGANHQIWGYNGNDTLLQGSNLNPGDSIIGGDDTDSVSYEGRIDRVFIRLNEAGSDGDVNTNENDNVHPTTENFVGGEDNDGFEGTSDGNHAIGGPGNDGLSGFDGNDTLEGGGDNDSLDGGNNEDNLDGGAGDDQLAGRMGNDTENGGPGGDTFTQDVDGGGANGADTMNGGADTDLLTYAQRDFRVGVYLNGSALSGDVAATEQDRAGGDIEKVELGKGDDFVYAFGDVNDWFSGPRRPRLHGSRGRQRRALRGRRDGERGHAPRRPGQRHHPRQRRR